MIALVVVLAALSGAATGYALLLNGHWKHARRDFQRREQGYLHTIEDLNNRLMYMADRTWTPPPQPPTEPQELPDPDFVFYPEQSVIQEP